MIDVTPAAVRQEASGPVIVTAVVDGDTSTAATTAVDIVRRVAGAVATDRFDCTLAVEMRHFAMYRAA